MSTDREVTRIVRSWLEEGATALPDRVLDAVLDQVPATPQRRAWWPARRSSAVNNTYKLLIAAAAVVVVAIVGMAVLPRSGGGIGGPGPTPSPTATPTATPTPAPTPVPLSAADTNRILVPGTYGVGATFSSPFSITVDAGWMANTLRTGEAQFSRDASAGLPGGISVEIVNGVFPDPCHTESGPTGSPAASTVDGLVGLLTGMTGFEAGPVTDAQIGGHAAKTFTLTNAIKTDTAACSGGPMLWLWTAKGSVDNVGTNGGAAQQIWVVDVSGTPVVIVGEGGPASDPASGSTRTIVESITFQ